MNGPFRYNDRRRNGWQIKKLGYIVQYDMEIQVPQRVELSVKTITEGNIDIQKIIGKCRVRHAN